MRAGGHERVSYVRDASAGLAAIVAIHDTRLGPAVGGTRLYDYETEAAALADALRLSRAMAYKCATAGIAYGGGKGVILASPTEKTDALLRAYARHVDALGGAFITGEDVNIDVADLQVMREETPYVGGSDEAGVDVTAHGVQHGIRACLGAVHGDPAIGGRRVVVQGVGKVGSALVERLVEAGAAVAVADVDPTRIERLEGLDVEVLDPEEVYTEPCDVFAPCAMGGVLNDETIPALACDVVCGSANNQLAERRHAEALADRGIRYAPDFVVNAGGLIAGTVEATGGTTDEAFAAAAEIEDRLAELLARADREDVTPLAAAERRAERVMASGLS